MIAQDRVKQVSDRVACSCDTSRTSLRWTEGENGPVYMGICRCHAGETKFAISCLSEGPIIHARTRIAYIVDTV
jgi:hypothetical protein